LFHKYQILVENELNYVVKLPDHGRCLNLGWGPLYSSKYALLGKKQDNPYICPISNFDVLKFADLPFANKYHALNKITNLENIFKFYEMLTWSMSDGELCCICLENNSNVYLGCSSANHVIVCDSCSEKITKCPICKEDNLKRHLVNW
jgi:hypothetical protein